MIDVNDQYDSLAGARLLDFFGTRTHWHRRLWTTGLVLTLKELPEVSSAVRSSILYQNSIEDLSRAAMALAGRDPGTGDTQRRNSLQRALRTELRFLGLDYRVVEQCMEEIDSQYLKRWADSLRTNTRAAPERAARAIASYLLDGGFSPTFLHRWWSFKLRYEEGVKPLAEIVEDAHARARSPAREYKVLVAFSAFTKRRDGMPAGWLDASAVSQWLKARDFDVKEIRQKGGILMGMPARDPHAAVELARERLEGLAARVRVGSSRQFTLLPTVWIDGESKCFSLTHDGREVDVHSLDRQNQLYAEPTYSRVDAGIELLEPLASAAPATAVASGWAALEALLSEPGNHAVVADRMGAIAACSFPRAELTVLSYQAGKADAALAARLDTCQTNRDRAEMIAREIESGPAFTLIDASDQAAVQRMKKLLDHPHSVLKEIETYTTAAFRRMYRQRNLVLHGGITNGVALRASLRTITPLVGAAMDRIAHAWYVDSLSPLELAARARIGLDTVGAKDGPQCMDLPGR
ncbi:MAG: hypothetical protein SFV51_30175 [Bryobacteraceae bacterium]|nr:hypothetical protein [Bryobacteraceae bacterium]